jgi:dimeric dUTPase (all-alpha-NTP-PPase superfamily)
MFKDPKGLLEAQQMLNAKYVPNWRESVSLEQFLTAAFTELAEWFESAPRSGGVTTNGVEGWKWWKKNLEDDVQNKKVEVIDILHFMMSSWLLISDIDVIKLHLEKGGPNIINDDSNLMNILNNFQAFIRYTCLKDIRLSVFSGVRTLKYLMKESDMTWEDLENGYYQKNKLNHNRVEGGYMDGNYQKYDENGQEDNRKLSL